MREIKFRLRIDNKIVGYEAWDGADPSIKPGWVYSKDGKIGVFGSIASWSPKFIPHRYKDQYTGLKDKIGVEIYEGDVIRDAGYVGVVDFKNRCFCIHFLNVPEDWEPTYILFYHKDLLNCEVIGNIYENPELLEAPNAPK